jgi:peptide deformylase
MPKILEIIELGNPILRKVAKPVSPRQIKSARIQTLIADMLGTCEPIKAVGLAAPQVGQSIRIIVIASKPTDAYPDAPEINPVVMINPVRIAGTAQRDGWEGCASIPGIRGIVSRDARIKVRWLDENGVSHESVIEDFLARIFQHEYDHLNGVVFTDRADPKTFVTEKSYQEMMKAKKKR